MGGRGSYSGKSTSRKDVIQENTSTQSRHLGYMSESELKERYTELGVSDPPNAAESVNHYTKDGYSGMREGKYPEEVKLIDEVIAKQPKWKGTIYRGMAVEDDFIDKIKNSAEGDSIQFSAKGPTSFSSKLSVARSFAQHNKFLGQTIVIFEMDNKRGSSITHNSAYPKEAEVLHRSSENYKIKKVYEDTDGYHVILEDSE